MKTVRMRSAFLADNIRRVRILSRYRLKDGTPP